MQSGMETPDFIPGELFDKMAVQPQSIDDLLVPILNILTNICFGPITEELKTFIEGLIPKLNSQLLILNNQTRTLKVALNMAKIGKLNREDEKRLIVEAVFVILMYIHLR